MGDLSPTPLKLNARFIEERAAIEMEQLFGRKEGSALVLCGVQKIHAVEEEQRATRWLSSCTSKLVTETFGTKRYSIDISSS